MVSVNWTWYFHINHFYVYNFIFRNIIPLFNSYLRGSHVWSFICLDASDDFSTKSTTTKVVFTRLSNGQHDATNFCINWNSLLSYLSRYGNKKRLCYPRVI